MKEANPRRSISKLLKKGKIAKAKRYADMEVGLGVIGFYMIMSSFGIAFGNALGIGRTNGIFPNISYAIFILAGAIFLIGLLLLFIGTYYIYINAIYKKKTSKGEV
jgi:DMSO/TMAO reductase YedYZ heme-binding membrane subunit